MENFYFALYCIISGWVNFTITLPWIVACRAFERVALNADTFYRDIILKLGVFFTHPTLAIFFQGKWSG